MLVKKIGEVTALEVGAAGIPFVYAPCLVVCRDPRWGRCYESYSEDPKVVRAMTTVISGLQGDAPANSVGRPYVGGRKKVAACAKNYVGGGGTFMGIDQNDTVIDTRGLMSIHMPPYYDAVFRGVSTVMISYNSWNGVKTHANHFLITDFLKNKLKFRGFVISDWQGIDRITSPPHKNYPDSIATGILAGIDMVMVPYNYTEFIHVLTSLVKNNIIPMSRIDDAVSRILRVKFTMGLFESPFADPSLAGEIGKQEHRELAREAVRRSLVLLKNGKSPHAPLLPLPKKARKILVAGSHAHNLGYQCGGWVVVRVAGVHRQLLHRPEPRQRQPPREPVVPEQHVRHALPPRSPAATPPPARRRRPRTAPPPAAGRRRRPPVHHALLHGLAHRPDHAGPRRRDLQVQVVARRLRVRRLADLHDRAVLVLVGQDAAVRFLRGRPTFVPGSTAALIPSRIVVPVAFFITRSVAAWCCCSVIYICPSD
ncbi:unnamed protein product [Urochloa humidicola]